MVKQLLAIIVALGTAGQAAAAEYVSKEKGFAVTFPALYQISSPPAPPGARGMMQLIAEANG